MGSPWAAPMKCTEQWAASSFAWQIDHGHGQPMGSPLCCPWAAHGQQNGQLYVFFDWGWVGLGWVGLGWVGLGWVGLGWAGLGWAELS